jgi:hypothetical protein
VTGNLEYRYTKTIKKQLNSQEGGIIDQLVGISRLIHIGSTKFEEVTARELFTSSINSKRIRNSQSLDVEKKLTQ